MRAGKRHGGESARPGGTAFRRALMPRKPRRGMTLIEVVVSFAIVLVAVGVMTSVFGTMGRLKVGAEDKAKNDQVFSAMVAGGAFDNATYQKTEIGYDPSSAPNTVSFTVGSDTYAIPIDIDIYSHRQTQQQIVTFGAH